VQPVLEQLDRELVGSRRSSGRIREIAAFLVVSRARARLGLESAAPSLHMSFTGNPGTGKTTVALRMAQILHRLGYLRKGHLVSVTRDDLVGQYIGHTAPKTKEVLKRAMGGVLFIDEAYLPVPAGERARLRQEAIEILLQVMENQRDDLVVILAGYKDRMDTFPSGPTRACLRASRTTSSSGLHRRGLLEIALRMAGQMNYRFDEAGVACAARVHRAQGAPAALRERPVDAQRAGSRAAAPRESRVRRVASHGRAAAGRGPEPARRGRRPGLARVPRRAGRRARAVRPAGTEPARAG